MAEGLALLGKCPRCSGELEFAERARDVHVVEPIGLMRGVAPHLAMGIPRR